MTQPPGPYGHPPYGQTPYGQTPDGQNPYEQTPYGQVGSGRTPYSQPYGQYGNGTPPTAPAPPHDLSAPGVPWGSAPSPPPYVGGATPVPVLFRPLPPQRPALIGMAATLAVTASTQLIGVVSFLWLIAVTAADTLGQTGADGAIFHMLNRFSYRMIDGLAWPLYLFPVAAAVAGFLLLVRRPWARILFSALGAAALAWSAWWLSSSLEWWAIPAAYVLFTCLITWAPSVSRWYAEGSFARA